MLKKRLILGLCLSSFILGLSTRSVDSAQNVSQYLASIYQAYQVIRDQSLYPPSEQELMTAASQGLVRGLNDPYSSFLTQAEFASLEAEQVGEIVGLGMELAYREQQVHIMSVIENTPAAQSQLRSGDIILAINDVSVSELSWFEINQMLTGELHSGIKLTCLQAHTGKEISVRLIREVLNLKAVELKRFEDGICQLKIHTFFNENLHEQILSALNNQGSCSALILDLQNNPGGLLQEALKLAGTLGIQGTVVQLVNREGAIRELSSSEPLGISQIPMLVLINQGTASAAEILAASLSESGRALLIGQQSFGKARVQNLLPLPEGFGLSLTTDKYLTRKGFDINGIGLEPDIYLDLIPGEQTALVWALAYLKIAIQP